MKKPLEIVYSDSQQDNSNLLARGSRTMKQLFAPSSISYVDDYDLRVENSYEKSFVVNSYPSVVDIGILNPIYDYKGDMDVKLSVIPSDDNVVLSELTGKISQYMAQLQIEEENGNISNLTDLRAKIDSLIEQRVKIERNIENMFQVQITSALYTKSAADSKKESQKLLSKVNGGKIGLMPLDIRNKEGYKTTSPLGINTIDDYYRNMNTGALTELFPFTNSGFSHSKGTFIGITKSSLPIPVMVDFFNKSLLPNANMFVSGVSGAGKTYFVSLLILRGTLELISTVVLDVEGEFRNLTSYLRGLNVKLACGSPDKINPFDLDIDYDTDSEGNRVGTGRVDIKAKISELLGLFSVMFPNLMDENVKSVVSDCINDLYCSFGFSEDPSSLYYQDSFVDDNGNFYHDNIIKPMPTMSDFRNMLTAYTETYPMPNLVQFHTALNMYTEGGIYDLFDGQTNVDINNEAYPVINFDISGVEDDVLRPTVMYVIMKWIFGKFVKKNVKKKKRVICDEAWIMLKKSLPGSEYTSLVLENIARRIRKYNGSLVVASQNFRECMSREEGVSILLNACVKMFFLHSPEDIASLTNQFLLGEGEKSFLLTAGKGEALVKIMGEKFVVDVMGFDFEDDLISRKFLENKE